MATNKKNPLDNSMPSQTEAQSIPGQIKVQAPPLTTGKAPLPTPSISGQQTPPYNDKKGKGNN
jgi:hypothetical protein